MPKPALGYPSKSDAIRDLLSKGVDREEVARRLDLSKKDYGALEASAMRVTSSRRKPGLNLPPHLIERARRLAARRGISVHELARRIITTVLEDNIADAVLDDRP